MFKRILAAAAAFSLSLLDRFGDWCVVAAWPRLQRIADAIGKAMSFIIGAAMLVGIIAAFGEAAQQITGPATSRQPDHQRTTQASPQLPPPQPAPQQMLLACEGTMVPRFGGEEVPISRGVTVDFTSGTIITSIFSEIPVMKFRQYTTDDRLVAFGDGITNDKNYSSHGQITIDRITGNLDADANGVMKYDGKSTHWYEGATMKCRPASKMF